MLAKFDGTNPDLPIYLAVRRNLHSDEGPLISKLPEATREPLV